MKPTLQLELEDAGPNLFGSNEVLRSVLAASNDCIKILDLEGRLQFMSEGGKRVMEVEDFAPLKGCPWPSFWEGEGNMSAILAVSEAKAGRAGHFRGPAKTAKGNERYWDVQVTPIIGSNGKPEYLLSVSRDITKERAAENALRDLLERQTILSSELHHRLSNTLAVVSAIARQTFKDEGEAKAREVFDGRLSALSRAHGILLQSNWQSATIQSVVTEALLSHRNDQFAIETDCPDLILPEKAALALALALNELATNAMKYGALSTPKGRINISWAKTEIESVPSLRFEWTETKGPVLKGQPERKGFGSRLVSTVLQNDFEGQVQVNYLPSGLQLTLTAPIEALQSEP